MIDLTCINHFMLRKYTAYFIELNLVLPPGFEPGCSAREAEMMGRTTLQELFQIIQSSCEARLLFP